MFSELPKVNWVVVALKFTHCLRPTIKAPVSDALTTLWPQSPHHSVNCPPGVRFDSRQSVSGLVRIVEYFTKRRKNT